MALRRYRSLMSGAGQLALIVLAACHNPAENAGSSACQQTFEFGNTGCFEISGLVVGLRGQALRGISVGPRPVPRPNVLFNGDYKTTDSTGQFRVRLYRMLGEPAANAADTLSVYVVAAAQQSAGLGVPATIRDSVLTIVTVAPLGTVPNAAEVRILLLIP